MRAPVRGDRRLEILAVVPLAGRPGYKVLAYLPNVLFAVAYLLALLRIQEGEIPGTLAAPAAADA